MFYCVPIHSDVSDLLKGTVQDNVNSSIGQLARSLDGVSVYTVCTYLGAQRHIYAVLTTPTQQTFSCKFP